MPSATDSFKLRWYCHFRKQVLRKEPAAGTLCIRDLFHFLEECGNNARNRLLMFDSCDWCLIGEHSSRSTLPCFNDTGLIRAVYFIVVAISSLSTIFFYWVLQYYIRFIFTEVKKMCNNDKFKKNKLSRTAVLRSDLWVLP